jgi:hypothetical protein
MCQNAFCELGYGRPASVRLSFSARNEAQQDVLQREQDHE